MNENKIAYLIFITAYTFINFIKRGYFYGNIKIFYKI